MVRTHVDVVVDLDLNLNVNTTVEFDVGQGWIHRPDLVCR